MKIVVFGAGGIGGYFGAMMARASHDVTLVCRGAHLDAIRKHGLRIRHGKDEFTVSNLLATDAPGAELADVVICGVKLYDLQDAAQAIRPVVGPGTLVVTTQNGIVAHRILAEHLARGSVCPGTVLLSSHIVAPGVIERKTPTATLTLGDPDGKVSPAMLAFQRAGREAGFSVELSADIVSELWQKFIMLAATAALCCLSRQPVGPITGDARLREQLERAMREAASVARALAIPLPPDLIEKAMRFTDRANPDAKVSMLEDLEAGRRLEVEWIIGELCSQGRRAGVPTPIADLALACLGPYRNGNRRG